MQKLLILVKLSVYIFFLSVNGIATSNVFSNTRGKLILTTIQFCFRLDLFLGLKEALPGGAPMSLVRILNGSYRCLIMLHVAVGN